ncbi:hypothetical protein SETIT_3G072600v2 [Setaria italica]|uniref:Bet v I/Major latex protein domain-containing protein n=1 Tax=Setaria italica TaxID=4555 RepID=K3Z9V7_SETIT|nr:lachrymatory-factor synthase [Setaria italica]RCV15631.1 hypothetical protein SETIT_3G072600v2 [Setaria italica]RCV15632.1 hypothetical protein SETIT_3G072600v2 [Setaria italica]
METMKEAAAVEQQQQQWRGVVEAPLPSTPASAAWPHIASFCALDRYLPGIDVCELAAGEDGRPGCVRYVASLAPAAASGDDAEREVASWAREELLEIDGAARRLAYAIVGNSMGFGRYVATMTVAADDGDSSAGCRLVWAFECEPVQGWSLDGLLGYLDGGVKAIAARIEEAEAAKDVAGGDDVAIYRRIVAQ